MQRFALPYTHFTERLGCCESWASVKKIGGSRTEAEAKSRINCLELMVVIFGLKAFCSRKSDSSYLHIFELYNDCYCLDSMGGTHFIECNSAAKDI